VNLIQLTRQIQQQPVTTAFMLYLSAILAHNQMTDWQVRDMLKVIKNRKFAWTRARGGSKTRDAVLLAVFFALRNYNVCWRAASSDQLAQARIYYEQNPFISKVGQFAITPIAGPIINSSTLTDKRSRSRRMDVIIYDELGSLHYEIEWTNYLASLGMISNSKDPHILYCSSVWTGSIFDRIMRGWEMLPGLEQEGLYTSHPKEDCTWVNSKQYRNIMPDWMFKCEFDCLWSQPGGAVFKNIKPFVPVPKDAILSAGVDWNPSYGHTIVVTGLYYKEAWVLEEYLLSSTALVKAKTDELSKRKISVTFEQGGTNMGFNEQVQGRKEQWTKEQKARKLVQASVLKSIYISRNTAPHTYNNLMNATWDPEKPGETLKMLDDHYLDAFLHTQLVERFDLQQNIRKLKEREELYRRQI